MRKIGILLFTLQSLVYADCLTQVSNSTGINSSKAFSIAECEHNQEIVESYRKLITKESYEHEYDFEDFSFNYMEFIELKATLRDGTKTSFSSHEFSFVEDYYKDFSNRDIIKIEYIDSFKGDKYLTDHILLINKDETELIAIKKRN